MRQVSGEQILPVVALRMQDNLFMQKAEKCSKHTLKI